MYIDFKNMITNSMTFNDGFANDTILSYNQKDIQNAVLNVA
jgi:hypothetical protein